MPTEPEILQGEFFEIPRELVSQEFFPDEPLEQVPLETEAFNMEKPIMDENRMDQTRKETRMDEARANDGVLMNSGTALDTFSNAQNLNSANHRRGLKDLSIPKLYYSISEVSRITGLEQYVLRYWETEFEELSPQKNRAGNRIYSNKDITFILRIKELLREKRYTIEGAKQILKDGLSEVQQSEKEASATNSGTDRSHMEPTITLEEIQEMKMALGTLREIFTQKG